MWIHHAYNGDLKLRHRYMLLFDQFPMTKNREKNRQETNLRHCHGKTVFDRDLFNISGVVLNQTGNKPSSLHCNQLFLTESCPYLACYKPDRKQTFGSALHQLFLTESCLYLTCYKPVRKQTFGSVLDKLFPTGSQVLQTNLWLCLG